jgi:transposase
VLFLDECHLLWGDVCGYVWGQTNKRIEIPIKNIKARQTYYGALNYQTKEFTVKEYEAGNSENTIDFIKHLQTKYQGKRIAVIWDGATYHKSAEFKDFLARENDNRSPDRWQINCIQLAPNAPEQNPVEDVWLQGKNCLRCFWYLLKCFKAVKCLFELCLDGQKFDFPKLQLYTPASVLN